MRSLVFGCLSLFSLVSTSYAKTYYVNPGQSIQAAINGASAGDRIQVAAGTYAEQLLINKDGIDLRGSAATLVPPANPDIYLCQQGSYDNIVGICITGIYKLQESVTKAVKGVSVTGFTFNGPYDEAIYVAAATDTSITNNRILGTTQFGVFVLQSLNTKIQANEFVGQGQASTQAIGVYGFNINKKSGNKIAQNTIRNYWLGMQVGDYGLNIENNDISDVCVGAGIYSQGDYTTVSHNRISAPNGCSGCGSLYGVRIFAADHVTVDHNTFTGLSCNSASIGIELTDVPELGTATSYNIDTNIFSNVDTCVVTNGVVGTQTGNKCN